MRYIKYLYIASIALLACSCQYSGSFENQVYFTGTEMTAVKRFAIDVVPATYPVSVSTAIRVDSEIVVDLDFAPELVDAYNAENETVYKPLPAGSYEMSRKNAVIEKGSAASVPVDFTITTIKDFEDGAVYLMPIIITESKGIPTLESCSVIYVIINRTIVTSAPNLDANYFFSVDQFRTDARLKDMKSFTMETRVRLHHIRPESDRPTSQALMGIEEVCLLRFGDVNIKRDQLQLAGGFCQLTAPTNFAKDVWYHVALTYDGSMVRIYIDGKLDASVECSKTVDLTKVNPDGDRQEAFRVGYAAGNRRHLWAHLSEMRVWSVARSQAEIVNNMCYVKPDSEGLIAYWRFNEGAGGLMKDYSPNGYDVQAKRYTGNTSGVDDNNIQWSEVRCEP